MEGSQQPLFDCIYSHGFVRVTVATPAVDVASPDFNADQTIQLARQAAADDSVLAVFPEMGLSAYSNEDLFLQDALLDGTPKARTNGHWKIVGRSAEFHEQNMNQ